MDAEYSIIDIMFLQTVVYIVRFTEVFAHQIKERFYMSLSAKKMIYCRIRWKDFRRSFSAKQAQLQFTRVHARRLVKRSADKKDSLGHVLSGIFPLPAQR